MHHLLLEGLIPTAPDHTVIGRRRAAVLREEGGRLRDKVGRAVKPPHLERRALLGRRIVGVEEGEARAHALVLGLRGGRVLDPLDLVFGHLDGARAEDDDWRVRVGRTARLAVCFERQEIGDLVDGLEQRAEAYEKRHGDRCRRIHELVVAGEIRAVHKLPRMQLDDLQDEKDAEHDGRRLRGEWRVQVGRLDHRRRWRRWRRRRGPRPGESWRGEEVEHWSRVE